MPDITKYLLEFLKLAPRYLVAVAIICGLMLFAGDAFLNFVGLRQFTQDNRHWIGFAFIASTVLFAVDRTIEIRRIVRNRSRLAESHERILQKLHSLTEEEKQILRFYIATESKTNELRINDGVVNGLVARGIIYRAAAIGNPLCWAHNISEFAWEYLNANPLLLDGTTNTYRTDKRERSRW